jgi:UDPglucose 6-dehydrogenase
VKVGVIGRGVVGRGVERLYEHSAVVAWDEKDDCPYPEAELRSCDCVVVCVGTPDRGDGHADLRSVRTALERLGGQRVILRSTVPPGTTELLSKEFGMNLCFWPEFTGESRYFNPFFPSEIDEVPFVVIGGPPDERRWVIDWLLPRLGPTKRYFQCTPTEAELIKYAENTYFATKITFVNEYRRVCEAFGADWHSVREGWLLDPRVEPMHTAAFADAPGFSGRCLPKDLAALIASSSEVGYVPELLREVSRSNARFRE